MKPLLTVAVLMLGVAVLEGCGSSGSTSSAPVAVQLGLGSNHSCAIMSDGGVRCWGSNMNQQLGACLGGPSSECPGSDWPGGDEFDASFRPARTWAIDALSDEFLRPLAGASRVTGGDIHNCALVGDGAVWCWGNYTQGKLGRGDTDQVDVAAPSLLVSGAVELASGTSHTCARLANGTVTCWGSNADGQLGRPDLALGVSSWSGVPTVVEGITGATRIAASGYGSSCALLSDGSVKCWGGIAGSLGGGTTNAVSLLPIPEWPAARAVEIALGPQHACVLLEGGRVLCRGGNTYGEAGNPSDPGYTSFVRNLKAVPGLEDASALALGGGHSCALRPGGTVSCWGRNDLGQLGDGTIEPSMTPVRVANLVGAVAIESFEHHTCALLAGGGVKCWGLNDSSQLGADREVVPYAAVPVDVVF